MRTFVLAKTGAIFGRAAWFVRSPGLAPLSAVDFPVIEGTWLLCPDLAERPLETQAEVVEGEEEEEPVGRVRYGEEVEEEEEPAEPRRRTVYHRLSVETPLDWDDWYDFYQAVIQPLVSEAGADVQLHLKLEARGEMDVNLIDLSVKESVQQFNRGAEVEAE